MPAKFLILMLFLCSDQAKTTSVDEAFVPSNVSTACHLKIDQSSLKKILKLIHQKEKNAIELNVWIESFNNTLNKSRVLTGINWANKMGRTLISLIAQAERVQSMIVSSYTSTLTPGVDNVDIAVFEKTKACLLFSKSNATDIVFNFLLHQLYQHDNGDDSDYQLCVKNTDSFETKYNCCRLLGRKSIPICSDYSSIQMEFITGLTMGTIYLFFFFGLPLTIEHLRNETKERIQYKISDSPMSFSSIFHVIFVEGYGPVTSLGRRLVFTVIVLVTGLPEWDLDYLWLYTFLCSWAIIFPFLDVYDLNKESLSDNSQFFLRGNPIKIIALPFNLKYLWAEVNRSSFFRKHFKLNLVNRTTDYQQPATRSRISESSRLLTQVELPQQPSNTLSQVIKSLVGVQKYCLAIVVLLILYLLIALPILCLFALYTLLSRYCLQWWNRSRKFFSCLTLAVLLISLLKCVILALYFIAGVYLNAGFYSSYFVPLSIILFYSWSNWKSSVEEKYLELNTKIYKACRNEVKVARPVTEGARSETTDHSIETESENNNSFKAGRKWGACYSKTSL